MKTTAKFTMLLLVISSFLLMMPQKAVAQASINFQVFYDNLSPHGYWVDNATYGYVWVPNVSAGFSPYGTNGYWVYTDVGWTWVSNYSWGWAPFHYGRWFYDPFYGWLWVPGYEWAPAWVVWRSSPGYYGWAPIGPAHFHVTYNQWIFVNHSHFGRTNIYNYYVSPSRNTAIYQDSRVVNNVRQDNSTRVRYNAGPDRLEVQKATKRAITPVTLSARSKPGQSIKNSEIQVYRPQVVKGKAAPSKVAEWKDRKPTTRTATSQPAKEIRSPKPLSQEKRAVQPVKQQVPERRSNSKAVERTIQQQRNDQNRPDRPVQQPRTKELPERGVNQQAAERQIQQQRRNEQIQREQAPTQMPQQRPSNGQTRSQQPMPQQQMPQQRPSNGQVRQQMQLPQQQMPQQQSQRGNGQQRGHQR